MYPYQIDYPIFDNDDIAPEIGLDRLRRVDANQNSGCLQQYSDGYLAHPELYFMVDGDDLKCLGVPGSIKRLRECGTIYYKIPEETKRSIEKRYPKLLITEPGAAYPPVDYVYIALSGRKFTPYYKALMEFKWRAGLIEFPLFERKDYLCVREDRLFGLFSIDNRQTWKLLTDKAVEKEIQIFKGTSVTNSRVKRTLAKELLKQHPEQTVPIDQKCIQVETRIYSISYHILLGQADIVEKGKFIRHRNNFALSPDGRAYFYALTQGDTNKLDVIAELLAKLCLRDQPSKYLWTILGSESEISFFLQLLSDVSVYVPGCAIYQKESDKKIRQLIVDWNSGCNCQVNPYPLNSESFKTVNHSLLEKFVTGELIETFDDPYIINNEVYGKGVLLCAATELNEQSFGRIPHKIIRLPKDIPELTEADIRWMQSCFLCHGLHLLTSTKPEPVCSGLNLNDAIRKFAKEFCFSKEGESIDREHFYDQFKEYCDAVINLAEKIPGKTNFAKCVESALHWSSKAIRKNGNRRGYENVFLDDEKIDAAIRDAEDQKPTVLTGQKNFDAYLDSFSKYLHFPGTMRTV